MSIISKYRRPQSGVVLIFTLVLLLLVTLTSASQIQQNRMELMMTAVLQQQTQRFAEAEKVLKAATNYIDAQRYSDKSIHQCKTTSDIYTQLPIQNNPSIGMTVNGLPFSLANVLTGVTLTNGSTAQISQTACLSGGLVESDCATNSLGYCYSTDRNNCPTEIYTLDIRIRDDIQNERVIRSRYAVRCDL